MLLMPRVLLPSLLPALLSVGLASAARAEDEPSGAVLTVISRQAATGMAPARLAAAPPADGAEDDGPYAALAPEAAGAQLMVGPEYVQPGEARYADREIGEGGVAVVRFSRVPMIARGTLLGGKPGGSPLAGARISSGFGYRPHPILGGQRLHQGVDFAAAAGSPVQATSAGVVNWAGYQGNYGLLVKVSHADGLETRFAHLSRLNVHVGDRVGAGDVVGFVGATGLATGPHLHYEVRYQGRAIDPLP